MNISKNFLWFISLWRNKVGKIGLMALVPILFNERQWACDVAALSLVNMLHSYWGKCRIK